MRQYIESFYVFVCEEEYKFDVFESNGVYTAQSNNSTHVVKSRNKESLVEQATLQLNSKSGDFHEG